MAVDEDGMLRLYVKVWYELSTSSMFSGLRSVWMRLRSWRTAQELAHYEYGQDAGPLTSHTGEELAGKGLDV